MPNSTILSFELLKRKENRISTIVELDSLFDPNNVCGIAITLGWGIAELEYAKENSHGLGAAPFRLTIP